MTLIEFFALHPDIDRIEIDHFGGEVDLTLYFEHSDESFSIREFIPGSPLREHLDQVFGVLPPPRVVEMLEERHDPAPTTS